jgi:putative ABC transport system permease protein
MFYELAQLALGNLMRARARLVMTAGGVLVGTAAVILLVALTFGLQKAAEAGIGSSGALTEIQVWPNYGGMDRGGGNQAPDDIPQLTVDAVRQLWQIDGVEAVIPMISLQGGELQAGDYFGYAQIMGIDPALLPYLGVDAEQGNLVLGRNQAIFGGAIEEQFYDPEASDEEWAPVTIDLFETPPTMRLSQWNSQDPQTRNVDVQVSAILSPSANYDWMGFMSLDQVLQWNEWVSGTEYDPDSFVYEQVTVRTANRELTNAVSEAIREMGYMPAGMGEFLNQLNNFFGTMRLMLGGVGGVALLVAAFGVANTMTMAILERTKEIGIMKAIGATDRDVLTVFLIEAGMVGFCGGAAGIGVALFLQNLINQAVQNMPQGDPSQPMFLPIDAAGRPQPADVPAD